MSKKSNNNNKDKDKKKGFFHFRFNFRRKHHSLIVDKEKDEYKFFSLTHSDKRKNQKPNIKLSKNPNPKDKKPAYIETRLLKDKENSFDKKKKSWSLSKADKSKVLDLYNSKSNPPKRRNKKKNK